VAGNARLTAANAAVLLVLLAVEGVTILRIRPLLSPHVFIGMVLIPGAAQGGQHQLAVRPLLPRHPAYQRKGRRRSCCACSARSS